MESSKISVQVDHEKNALGAGYIIEFIHDATENYYERGSYASTYCNNIKFPLTTIHENKFAYVESSKNSMLIDHEKNALGAGYIVEFIHDVLKIIMREEYMLVGIAIISSFLSMCLKF